MKTQKREMPEDEKLQLYFLLAKLNSDMLPAAADKFIPLLCKEIGELKMYERR